jgi:hypothetical protein
MHGVMLINFNNVYVITNWILCVKAELNEIFIIVLTSFSTPVIDLLNLQL